MQGGKGMSEPVGEAVRGYTNAVADVALMQELGLDSYRFSVDWSRVEPSRDEVSQDALDHYGAQLDALRDAGIEPMITLHHFSNPIWVDDFREEPCAPDAEPTSENLCGWDHPNGGELVIEELAEHAALLAQSASMANAPEREREPDLLGAGITTPCKEQVYTHPPWRSFSLCREGRS